MINSSSYKIGILQADYVRRQWIEQHGDYLDMFKQLLLTADSNLQLVNYECFNDEFPADINEVDGYLITGSRYGVYDDKDWIGKLGQLIIELNRAQKKLVGVCFGHQMIAHFLGGEAKYSDKGWGLGLQKVNCQSAENPENLAAINIRLSHQDQVITPATGARVIGSNAFCSVSICAIDNHILSFQGHPEFSKAYALQLIELRRDSVDEASLEQFRQSLAVEADNSAIARWIMHFYRH